MNKCRAKVKLFSAARAAAEGRNDAAHPNWPRRRDEYDTAGSSEG